ncbi:hypothetical protein Daura_24490 [Dactylosporangium aurantiacum]|uniref:Lipoprotein n=1 Tax=Dactylosporangium aurantiacum TaxID=35754 RepID=A0A9Q9IMS8_9ACTN|nr:hypothetical protein [Dactylosporangium aurantiacum]MDG6103746.1 hypothetical protein [Dactylosporangium aurantiacum]UWZ59039.1 hypothetical protein Daura_24490 [Dactylosporangium aurantiacum]
MRARRPLTAAAAVLLILAGCGRLGGGGGTGGAGGTVAAPEGGWPTTENGRVTAKMCGLLTRADFRSLGHRQLLDLAARTGAPPASNAVECDAPAADFLGLNVQPTAEAATIWHASSLAGRKREVLDHQRDTILVENVVAGADESWFDYWLDSGEDSEYRDYQLHLRRGALIVELHLGGIQAADAQDPKATLTTLADRVLQRVGDLGTTDTGNTPTMHLEVLGTGTARSISYIVPDVEGVVRLDNVALPWRREVRIAEHGRTLLNVTLNADSTGARVPPPVGCRMLLDGKLIVEDSGEYGLAQCLGTLPTRS